jgi:hypothetical protein
MRARNQTTPPPGPARAGLAMATFLPPTHSSDLDSGWGGGLVVLILIPHVEENIFATVW